MKIPWTHFGSLVADYMLVGLLISRKVYEFPIPLVALVILRMLVGHLGRIVPRLVNLRDDLSNILMGMITALIKFLLELAMILYIMESKGIDISGGILVAIVVFLLFRSAFEAVSMSKALIEEFSE